uniref:Uncharacterized protein n=1 Tax=Tanacetum cinerariifolium TaxID=118510 RepID=A0A699GTS9_TANCI|nr:hypothetical protein [Tanacetum cinerariifolium]
MNRERTRRNVHVKTTNSLVLVSCHGLGCYDWSDQAKEGPNYALMAYSTSSSDFEVSKEFTSEPAVKTLNAKPSEEVSKLVKKDNGAPIIIDWKSNDEDESVPQPMIEKKTIKPRVANVEFVKPKQQSQNARPVNTAHLKSTVNAARQMSHLSKSAHSSVKRPIHKKTAFTYSNVPQKVNIVRSKTVNTARPKAVVNIVLGNRVNVVKASAVNIPQSDEDRLKHIKLMKIYTTLQKKVFDLKDELKMTKTTQQTKIDGIERRVKKHEKKHMSRTYKLKRLYKVGLTAKVISSSDDEALDKEDTSKQGMIDEIDDDEDFALMIIDAIVHSAHATTAIADIPVSAAKTIVTTAPTIIVESIKTNIKITLASKRKGVMIQKPEETTTTTKTASSQQSQVEDKAKKLQAEMQVEIDEDDRLARERAQRKQEANYALINTWDDIQAKIDADAQLA